MTEYLIKNGFVFDPVLGIRGDVTDIAIKGDKIVETDAVKNPRVIDATGKTVMAGGVDVHAHVAGPKVNIGRNFRPEDKLFNTRPGRGVERMQGGFSVPTTIRTGYNYARMGYTTVMEAAMPPLYARHTHEEMRDTPIIDQGAFPVFGNNWFVLEYLKNNEIDNAAAYIAWLLRATKGYAVKVVNPGGTEAWGWGLNCENVHDPVPYFDITPAQIVRGLIEANEYLGLPHSMHIHANNLGNPGNYTTTLDTFKLSEGVKPRGRFGRDQVMHHTHVQFHSYGGDSWGNMDSKADKIMDYVNSHDNITIDMGQVTLDETTTMTADGPFEHHLTELNHLKWANADVGSDCSGCRAVCLQPEHQGLCHPVVYRSRTRAACEGSDAGLHDHRPPERRTVYPLPRIMKWLMSQEAREQQLDAFKHKDKVIDATHIAGIDRELDLYEIAQMTRAGSAKALGISDICGGLAPGLTADVAVFDFNPNEPYVPDDIEKAFGDAEHLFKTGVHVINGHEIVSNGNKRTLWVNARVHENPQVVRDVKEKFLRYYTVTLNNYEVHGHHYVPNPYVIEVDATQ